MEFGCGEGGGSSHNRRSNRDPQARWALLVQISSALSRVQFPRAPRKGVDALEFGCRESGGGARGVTYLSGSRWIGAGRSTLPPRRLPHSYCRHGSYGGGRVSGEALASTARRRRGKYLRGPRWRPRRRGRSGVGGWSGCRPLWTNTRCLSERTASAEASLRRISSRRWVHLN